MNLFLQKTKACHHHTAKCKKPNIMSEPAFCAMLRVQARQTIEED